MKISVFIRSNLRGPPKQRQHGQLVIKLTSFPTQLAVNRVHCSHNDKYKPKCHFQCPHPSPNGPNPKRMVPNLTQMALTYPERP